MKNLVLYIVFTTFGLGDCLSIYPPPGKCKVGDCCLPWMKDNFACHDLCSRVRVKCADPCGGQRREDVCCGRGKPPSKFKACCYNFACPQPPSCRCTKEYNPYCCSGTTYGNPCMAKCKVGDKFRYCKQGKCGSLPPPVDCICTMQYDPVCCNGKTYGNACSAGCARAKNCRKGECQPQEPPVCSRHDFKYCCSGGYRKGPRNPKCCALVDCPQPVLLS